MSVSCPIIFVVGCFILDENESARLAVIDRALSSRDSLVNSYHLVVNSTNSEGQNADKDHSERTEIWVDDRFVRTDSTVQNSKLRPGDTGRRSVQCRECVRKGFVLFTMTGSGLATSIRSAVTFVPLEKYDVLDPWKIDWRRLGLYPGELAQYASHTPDAVLLSLKKLSEGAVEYRNRDGYRCAVIRSRFGTGTRHTWFRPDLGMNPVFFDDSIPDKKYIAHASISYINHASAGCWFPTTMTVESFINGERVRGERLTMEKVELNSKIADKVFSLEGLGLLDGQPVIYPEIKKPGSEPIWRNGSIDPNDTLRKSTEAAMKQLSAVPPTPDQQPASRFQYILGAALLAFLAAVALVFARRRKS